MRSFIILFFAFFAFSIAMPLQSNARATPAQQEEQKINVATKAAEEWIALQDQGNYHAGYTAMDDISKKHLTSQQWFNIMNKTRSMFGPPETRKVKSQTYATQLPNAPKGQYVTVIFVTDFKSVKDLKETAIMMLGKDNVWRVASYQIRR